MRRDHKPRHRPIGRVRCERFRLPNVDHCTTQLAGSKPFDNRVDIDDSTTRNINQHCVVVQRVELIGSDRGGCQFGPGTSGLQRRQTEQETFPSPPESPLNPPLMVARFMPQRDARRRRRQQTPHRNKWASTKAGAPPSTNRCPHVVSLAGHSKVRQRGTTQRGG